MKILFLIVGVVYFALPAQAIDHHVYSDDIIPQEIVDNVAHALPGEALDLLHDITPSDATNWQSAFDNIIAQTGREASGAIRAALLGFLMIIAILLICGIVGGLREPEDVNGHDFVQTAGALAIGVTAMTQINGLLQLGSRIIEQLTIFSNVLLPAMTTAAIVSGQPGSAIAKQSAAVLFGGILMNIMQGVLIPILYGYIALSVAHAAAGHETLGEMAQLFKWLASR